MSRKNKDHHSIADCLSDLGVTPQHLVDCASLEEEFAVVKKLYYRKMLTDHPDKGGSAEAARQNITAWETLRELKAKNKLKSLTQHVSDVNVDDIYQAAEAAFNEGQGGIPCYDHFYEAASVAVPGYKVELAKSDRSQCVACKKGTGTSLKKKMEKAAAAARGEVEEPKKKGKAAAKGGGKKGKKKRGASHENKEEDKDESKPAAEEDSKPPARKRGRKANNSKVAEEEEVVTAEKASTGAAKEEEEEKAKKVAATVASAVEQAASHPPTTRVTRSRAAKSEAIVAIADSSSSSNNNTTKKVPPAASKKAPPAATKATAALAKAGSSKELVVPPLNPNFIPKGSIRVGSMDEYSGSYGRWHRLECWRVPYRVWAGLTNPADAERTLFELLRLDEVLLTGLTCLPQDDQDKFCAHVMDKSNWAKKTKRSKPPPDFSNAAATATANVPSTASAAAAETTLNAKATAFVPSSSTDVVDASKQPPQKQAFVIPRPGVDGAMAGCLEGQRFVLTGTFPEVGGGASLNLGKDKVKAMIESFGGTVTGSLSGKTNFLVVGKEPGQVKVGDATKRGLPRVDLMALQNRVLGRIESLEDAKPAVIKAFSAGYGNYNLTNG